MSKVFRHHTIAAHNTMNGWGLSTIYNSAIIDDMQDPAGASASAEITSIPSPFARMALVKAAFAWVNNNDLDGNTIHHKMVSHCLDVGQIFFNFENYKGSGDIKIIKWDKSRATNLMNSQHGQLLGRTLDLFMTQDADTYHFGNLQSIYLLQYTGEGYPSPMTIIGATSPATLFVTPANDMDYVKNHIRWGNHDALQSDPHTYQPLYDRDPEYIVWLFAMRRALPNFAIQYKEVNAYLDKTFARLPQALKSRITTLLPTTYNTDYLPLEILPNVPVEICQFPLRQKNKQDISEVSDFTISSSKTITGDVPLVLPDGLFTQPWKYVSDLWDSGIRVQEDPRSLEVRTLPSDGTKWPYLTISDFLEPTIVEMDTDVVKSDFFDGNLEDKTTNQEGTGYLLPIKKRYFDYFSPEDLKKHFKLVVENIAGGGKYVKAILTIPIKNGRTITYEKSYMPFSGINDGSGLVDHRLFTMALFPVTKFVNGVRPDYRIMFMSSSKNWEPNLTCYDENGMAIQPVMQNDRNTDSNNNPLDITAPTMPVYAIDKPFTYIQLVGGGISGIAIPMWKGISGGADFHFAVDFGTTNTHIEYRIGNAPAKPLDITNAQLAILNSDAERTLEYRIPLFNTVIPNTIGSDKDVKFPMRTVLYFKKNTNWNAAFSPYVTGNMPFYYGIHKRGENNDIEYNLKWSHAAGNVERINCYLGSLMLLMRNKVLMEGGSLTNTTITWFYPTSMAANMVANIQNVWGNLFNLYFGGNTNQLKSIPESIAPYAYYKNRFGAGVDVLTIDIGGGTSDAMIVDHNGDPAFVTSFRFAANSLFGDAFTDGDINNNGFIRHYRPQIMEILTSNNLEAPKAIMEEVAVNQPAVDLVSYFFTLKDNIDVKNANVSNQLDFIHMMSQDAETKTLMLIFYSSIIYHLAMFIKAKKAEGHPVGEPAYLAFSGNGSKLLQILGAGTPAGTDLLSEYTIAIFEKVMGENYPHHTIKFVTDYNSPKEATSRGGLDTTNVPSRTDLNKMVQTYLGTTPSHFVDPIEQYNSLSDKDWEALEDSIKAYTNMFFELAQEKDIENNFGTISYAQLQNHKNIFGANIKTGTRSALSYLGLLNQPVRIENTLFFYPITNIIHELAQKIL